MRKLLTLTCCIGIASLVGAAQNDENNNQNKKKGGNQPPPQHAVTPQPGKKYKTGPGAGPHYKTTQNFQNPNTVGSNTGNVGYKGNKAKWQNQTNVSGAGSTDASSTKFNKTKFGGPGNAAANKNFKYEKHHFDLQTNNKEFVVNKYKTVNYNANYKIPGAYKWKGAQYQVFANYHPEWHDAWWWNWHHPQVVFIFGGWYYWNSSYWYPAWGYAPNSVYVYDGPIYASSPSEDPGQVVANVQSALQQQGYYQGDVDGILGPQTRAALAEYQTAQGLEPTGAVDEPTLETLGMA